MNTALCHGAVLVVVLFAACGSPAPTAPTVLSQPSVMVSPPTSRSFPPLEGASRIFTFDRELSYRVSGYTQASRFVLYENGAFVLQSDSVGARYRGGYTNANGVITFDWEGWSVLGPWGATGSLRANSLTVNYNQVMLLNDFEDAVYVLTP